MNHPEGLQTKRRPTDRGSVVQFRGWADKFIWWRRV